MLRYMKPLRSQCMHFYMCAYAMRGTFASAGIKGPHTQIERLNVLPFMPSAKCCTSSDVAGRCDVLERGEAANIRKLEYACSNKHYACTVIRHLRVCLHARESQRTMRAINCSRSRTVWAHSLARGTACLAPD